MPNYGYQEALRQLVKEIIDDLIDDVIGLAEWKIRQKGNNSNRASMEQQSSHLIQVHP